MARRTLPSLSESSELSVAILREIFAAFDVRPRLFLELGANDGSDTNRLLAGFPGVEIHCFEPEPRAIRRFRQGVRSSRAHLYECAVGATDGVMTFYRSGGAPPGAEEDFPDGWDLSGSLRQPAEHLVMHPWCEFDEGNTLDVKVTTLDSWASEQKIGAVDFVWADIQGAELDMITGAQQTFA